MAHELICFGHEMLHFRKGVIGRVMTELRVLEVRVDVVGESLSVCEDKRALLAL